MNFGKHKGKPLNEVPRDYLVWAIENAEIMKPELRREIEAFLGLPLGSTGPPLSKPGDVKLNDIKANETLTEDEQAALDAAQTLPGTISVLFIGDEQDQRGADFMRRLALVGGGMFAHKDLAKSMAIEGTLRGMLALPAPIAL